MFDNKFSNNDLERKSVAATNFTFPQQTKFYRGKVRDVYTIADKFLVMIASDRISAFDHILPRPIPYKGQVLNQIATTFLSWTSDIVPNWLTTAPDENAAIGLMCEPYRVEMVIRGYLTGHAWREYRAGKRTLCGVTLPEGMKEHDKFPEPIITPATKAMEGHDEDISREDILKRVLDHGIVGLGGATFPSHVKLNVKEDSKIDCLIINGVECEPYLTADHLLMLEKTQELLVGIQLIMKALNVNQAIIGIENNKPDAIEALEKATQNISEIKVQALKVQYPQGGEKQLINATISAMVRRLFLRNNSST